MPGSHGDVQHHIQVQIAVGVHGHRYQVGLGMVEGGEMLRWVASGMNGCKLMMHYLEFKNSDHFWLRLNFNHSTMYGPPKITQINICTLDTSKNVYNIFWSQ